MEKNPQALRYPITNITMVKRNVEVSLTKAREWYKSGNKALKEVALQAFNEEELKGIDYKSITTLEDACNALDLDYDEVENHLTHIRSYSTHAAIIYELDIVCRALNGNEIPRLTSGVVYYPLVDFYPLSEKPNKSTLILKGCELGSKFTHEGTKYILAVGSCNCLPAGGISNFYGYGYIHAHAGLFGCKSREIAKHMSKYFGKLIFDAVYSQYGFITWLDKK